jgi:hypothetical protein
MTDRPSKPRISKVVDNTVPPPSPEPSAHDVKVARIADLAPVREYAKRLINDLGADMVEPQG